MIDRVERPDLVEIQGRVETLHAETWGFIRADDELWRFKGSLASVGALVELVDDTDVLLAYARQLEQDAAALREQLAEMRQEARNLWVIAHGDNCCWEDECKRPGRKCKWPLPALLEAGS